MSGHRFRGFYEDHFHQVGILPMSIEDKNNELNEVASDRLKQLQVVIEEYEASLKKLLILRDVWHTYRTQDHEDEQGQYTGSTDYMIGMTKVGGSWRLCHGIFDQWGPGHFDSKPLVDTPIPLRFESVKHLEALRHEIVEKKKELIPEIEDAIRTVEAARDNPKSWSEVTRKKGHFPKPKVTDMLSADIVHALIKDDSDIITVWTNPNMANELREGGSHYEPKVIGVHVPNLDGLFALQLHVRQLRGVEGMLTRQERLQELLQLAKSNPEHFRRIIKKRKGFVADEPYSEILIARLANDISHEEIAWESV
jgi:hypothetical protein